MLTLYKLLFDVDWTSSGGAEDLDVLVIDMPPGTGDVQLSLGQLVDVDGETGAVRLAGTKLTRRRCHRLNAPGRGFDRC